MTYAETSPSQVRDVLGQMQRQNVVTPAETYPSQVLGVLGQRQHQSVHMTPAET